MSNRWPVTIRDSGGGFIEVDVAPSGNVWLCTSAIGFIPNADQQDEYDQAYNAASLEAEQARAAQ